MLQRICKRVTPLCRHGQLCTCKLTAKNWSHEVVLPGHHDLRGRHAIYEGVHKSCGVITAGANYGQPCCWRFGRKNIWDHRRAVLCFCGHLSYACPSLSISSEIIARCLIISVSTGRCWDIWDTWQDPNGPLVSSTCGSSSMSTGMPLAGVPEMHPKKPSWRSMAPYTTTASEKWPTKRNMFHMLKSNVMLHMHWQVWITWTSFSDVHKVHCSFTRLARILSDSFKKRSQNMLNTLSKISQIKLENICDMTGCTMWTQIFFTQCRGSVHTILWWLPIFFQICMSPFPS